MVRLQKYMAESGIGSRRKCEEIIKEGRVMVDGVTVTDMGLKVDAAINQVKVDGRCIHPEDKKVYILFHKPKGTITSLSDPQNRTTVIEQVGWKESRIFPVGRLDYDTEGLLILTNDGDLAYRMTHPKHQIDKEYYVCIPGKPTQDSLNCLRSGIDIGDFITSRAVIKNIQIHKENTSLSIIIREGKNRQVRRMFEAIGHPVLYLRRERIDDIMLGDLKVGAWRHLTSKEIERLKSL